jgi:hypothetical protein
MRNLFFWRGIEDAAFKPVDGGFVFYPYGTFGSGYTVDAERKAAIVAFMRQFYLAATVVLVAQIIGGPFVGYFTILLFTVPALAVLMVWFHFAIRARLAGAPRSSERLGFAEAQRQAAQTMSKGRIVTILVLGVLLVVGSLFGLALGLRTGDLSVTLSSAFGIVFFSFCLAMGGYNAWIKWGRHA